MKLLLIGYRGTGKSTLARRLALRLGWDWLDTDVEVELRAGCSISELFANVGEAAFRDLESAVLAELAARERLVVGCGGGIVLRKENRTLLADWRAVGAAHVVWLRAQAATLAGRLAADTQTVSRRPNLTPQGGLAEIEALLVARQGLYAECAELTVDTDDRAPDDLATEILSRLRLLPPEGPAR